MKKAFASFMLLFRLRFTEVWLPALPGGGDDGIRTHDPLLAGQVLSQLSYTPILAASC